MVNPFKEILEDKAAELVGGMVIALMTKASKMAYKHRKKLLDQAWKDFQKDLEKMGLANYVEPNTDPKPKLENRFRLMEMWQRRAVGELQAMSPVYHLISILGKALHVTFIGEEE